jgi:hypothetical protein
MISDKGLKLEIQGSITIDCTKGEVDPMTKAFLQIAGVFAELERNMISQRVKSGMANTEAKLGRPARTITNLPSLFQCYYPLYRLKKIKSQEHLAQLCNTSRQSISKYIKIMEKIDEKVCEMEMQDYEKKERKKEIKGGKEYDNLGIDEIKELAEIGTLKYKRLSLDILKILVKDEDTAVWQDGISEFTPATKELERRKKLLERKCEKALDSVDMYQYEYNEYSEIIRGIEDEYMHAHMDLSDIDLSDFD